MACKNQKYSGRVVVLEYQIGCGDTLPNPAGWKRFSAMRTKEFTLEWETIDATADDSVGSLRENIASFQTLSISGDGTAKASGKGFENLVELTKHVANPTATDGQPVVWMRMTFPDITFTAFMLLSSMSRSAPYDDLVTYSMEASATASDFGLIVEDTPDTSLPAVTSLTITGDGPATVGTPMPLAVTVLPAEAPAMVTWFCDSPDIGTIDQAGVFTPIAAGTADIRAVSKYTPAVSDSTEITVTA